jgi:hypothetical protein
MVTKEILENECIHMYVSGAILYFSYTFGIPKAYPQLANRSLLSGDALIMRLSQPSRPSFYEIELIS